MHPFTTLTSAMIPLPIENVDTDQIIPARYLKVTGKAGLAEGLFAGWRYRPDGSADPGFPLNQPAYQGCQILLAGDNFGCGSSREHAPWALAGWGIRAVISSSFADIFYNNALKNGLLPVTVPADTLQELFSLAGDGSPVTIDLGARVLQLPDRGLHGLRRQIHFPIDPFNQKCLLEGIDTLGYLLKMLPQIEAFEAGE